jgi:hypothetical protein
MRNLFTLLLFSLILMVTSCSNYSSGERVGIITKVSNKGALWKSDEIQMKIAPNIASQGMVGQYENFECSVDNDKTIPCTTPIDSIKLYAQLGIPVVVTYQQVKALNWFGNRGSTDYFVRSVTRTK